MSGAIGSTVALYYVGNGIIAGVDAGGMKYDGAYRIEDDGSYNGNFDLRYPARCSANHWPTNNRRAENRTSLPLTQEILGRANSSARQPDGTGERQIRTKRRPHDGVADLRRPTIFAARPSPRARGQARDTLKWTPGELAGAAGVTPWVVAAFEEEREVSPADEAAIRAALEAVGISFSFEIANGRARPAGVTYSPRDRNKGR